MGCNNSVQFQTEIAALTKEKAQLESSLRDLQTQMSSLRLESDRAKTSLLALSEENQKLSYALHTRKHEEAPIETKVFESTKEEFSKVKEWSELEIENGNNVLQTLLEHSSLTPKDADYKEMESIMKRVKQSIYDPDQLIELCKLRAEFVEDLLQDCIDFREEVTALVKALESTVAAALKVVSDVESGTMMKNLAAAGVTEKLKVMRAAVKKYGFNGSYAAVVDTDREAQLESEVADLKQQLQACEAQIKTQRETIEELENAQAEAMEDIESEATPAPDTTDERKMSRRLTRRSTLMDSFNPLQADLAKANERLRTYEEKFHDVQLVAKAVRGKQSKEGVLQLMISLETMAEAVKERDGVGYGAQY